jgi:CYTH domain-containing protein
VILAEVELDSLDQPIDLPERIGREVTGHPAYSKRNMVETSGAKRAESPNEVLSDASS